jgi:hypothetical protein
MFTVFEGCRKSVTVVTHAGEESALRWLRMVEVGSHTLETGHLVLSHCWHTVGTLSAHCRCTVFAMSVYCWRK